jgi:hypothetical protein
MGACPGTLLAVVVVSCPPRACRGSSSSRRCGNPCLEDRDLGGEHRIGRESPPGSLDRDYQVRRYFQPPRAAEGIPSTPCSAPSAPAI